MSCNADDAQYALYETLLSDALRAGDLDAARRALVGDPRVAGVLASAVPHAREDGFRIAALLVARLRFERLLHGSRAAGDAFRADARAFTERFRAYHREVEPRATTPAEEAADFERWSSA